MNALLTVGLYLGGGTALVCLTVVVTTWVVNQIVSLGRAVA